MSDFTHLPFEHNISRLCVCVWVFVEFVYYNGKASNLKAGAAEGACVNNNHDQDAADRQRRHAAEVWWNVNSYNKRVMII